MNLNKPVEIGKKQRISDVKYNQYIKCRSTSFDVKIILIHYPRKEPRCISQTFEQK